VVEGVAPAGAPTARPSLLSRLIMRLLPILPPALRPDRPSMYRQTLAFVDTRQMLRVTSRLVAGGCVLYAGGIIGLCFVRGGVTSPFGRVVAAVLAAVLVGSGVGWWWRGWPRRRYSALFAATVELTVPIVMALCQHPSVALLAALWFFLIADYLIFAHSRAAIELHSLWVLINVLWAGARGIFSLDTDPVFVSYVVLTLLTAVVLLPLFNQSIADTLRRGRRRSVDLAHRDPLTQLLNRRGLDAAVTRLFARAAERRMTIAVLLLDVDRFKAVNDNHGHQAGDAVLALLGERLKRSVRQGGLVARSGGEEFVVVDQVHPDGVKPLSERLRAVCSNSEDEIPVTVSVGVAMAIPPDDQPADPAQLLADLVIHADNAMYLAKRAGGNRVEIAQPLPEAVPGS
jgi:diguanylate cyclase (GGDEF)-like protein